MPYIFIEKATNRAEIYGSMVAISQNEGISEDTLQYHFTRKKRTEYENKKYRIVKRDLISSNGA